MRVLIACEESQEVCKAFRNKGHEAYSCDIVNCSGGHPEWHIKGNVLPLIDGNCEFITMDFTKHRVEKWDIIIAFPPCTHLAVSGARHFEKKRSDGRQRQGIEFFCKFLYASCNKIAIENPIGIIGGEYIKKWYPEFSKAPKCTQIIQPYEYGHHARKSTCLWLKNLPNLKPTEIVDPGFIDRTGHSLGASSMYALDENGKILSWNDPRTAKIRSKTFPGIAKAMAEQWG